MPPPFSTAVHALLAVLLAGVLVACGSGGDEESSPEADATPRATATPSEDPTDGPYLTDEDTTALNAAAAAATKSGQTAAVPRELRRCNSEGEAGYDQWRACWHGLLDPYVGGLEKVSAELDSLADGDLAQACRDEAQRAAQAFEAFASDVQGLVTKIDSARRSEQVAAMKEYATTLREVGTDFGTPFEDLTQACYPAERLAELEASASATP
jgi:hypothetical protein